MADTTKPCHACEWGDPKPRRHEPWCAIGARYYEEIMGRKPYSGKEAK